ncbi:MAG: alpha/beta hydrolase [Verrucomicrobiota bacterium]
MTPHLSPQSSRLVLWLKRLVMGGFAFLIVIALAGAVFQRTASLATERRFPVPGRLVDVGGHRLHINTRGKQGPSVVVEDGLMGASFYWDSIGDKIAAFTQVTTYDRAGLGWSDPGPLPRTSQQIVSELHTLLQKAQVKPPYILVGYSMGGQHVRLYASKYPDEIAGLVLVDAANFDLVPKGKVNPPSPILFDLLYWTAPLGIARLYVPFVLKDPTNNVEVLKFRREMQATTKALRGAYHEIKGNSNWREVSSEIKNLGDKPVVVISHRIDEGDTLGEAGKHNRSELERQKALLDISRNSRSVVATSKLHTFPVYEPDPIINAIRELVETLRKDAPTH